MRLFAALQPSQEVLESLASVQACLRARGVSARYLDPANLHMTLAFIGQWPDDVSPLLPSVPQPFSLRLSRLGLFPEADVLWAGVETSGELDALVALVRQRLDDNSIPYDRKPFVPHITLARKPRLPHDGLLEELPVPHAVMTVRDVCLYRSDHLPQGMAYTVIGRSTP